MKPYSPLRMLVTPAFVLCLIATSCQKESTPPIDTNPATTASTEHRTIVLQADAGILAAPNVEMGIGNYNGSDYSTYPTEELNALSWTINTYPVTTRGLIKFSSLPSGGGQIPPVAAYLTLYSNPTPHNGDLVNANSGSNNSIFIRRVTTNWVPTSTNWFNQPAITTQGQVSIPHTNSPFLDLVNIDVTQIVHDIYVSGNYGFMIQLQSENYWNSRMFCSSTHPDASRRPKLTVVF